MSVAANLARIGALLLGLATLSVQAAPPSFEELLAEGGLEFAPPAGFAPVEVAANPVFGYEHAMQSADGAVEVRYAVRPLARLGIEYQDPHSSAPHPNDLFKMLFDQVTIELAGTRESFVRRYGPEAVRERFKAQWASAALFDIASGFSERHAQAMLIAIHRDDRADAYIVCLFDDYDDLRAVYPEVERSLSFLGSDAEPVADRGETLRQALNAAGDGALADAGEVQP
jgi:hypothetical protein